MLIITVKLSSLSLNSSRKISQLISHFDGRSPSLNALNNIIENQLINESQKRRFLVFSHRTTRFVINLAVVQQNCVFEIKLREIFQLHQKKIKEILAHKHLVGDAIKHLSIWIFNFVLISATKSIFCRFIEISIVNWASRLSCMWCRLPEKSKNAPIDSSLFLHHLSDLSTTTLCRKHTTTTSSSISAEHPRHHIISIFIIWL